MTRDYRVCGHVRVAEMLERCHCGGLRAVGRPHGYAPSQTAPMARQVEQLDCRQCEANATVMGFRGATETYCVDQLPRGWIVWNTYPPGDDGLGFFCSESCLAAWRRARGEG